jgi:hypothetical protein
MNFRLINKPQTKWFNLWLTCATLISISIIAGLASAWYDVIFYMTYCSWSTITCVSALFINTCQIVGTITISRTFRTITTDQWISHIAIQTVTSGMMIIVATAHGISTTLCIFTRIYAFTINTCLCRWTVTIGATPNCKVNKYNFK